MPPSRWACSIGRAGSIFLLIVATLVLLPLIAFAGPPDPLWIGGIYDGGDGDDIVTLVYETSGSTTAEPSNLAPLRCLLETSSVSIVNRLAGGHSTQGSRSPPVLRTIVIPRVFDSPPPLHIGVTISALRASRARVLALPHQVPSWPP